MISVLAVSNRPPTTLSPEPPLNSFWIHNSNPAVQPVHSSTQPSVHPTHSTIHPTHSTIHPTHSTVHPTHSTVHPTQTTVHPHLNTVHTTVHPSPNGHSSSYQSYIRYGQGHMHSKQ